MKIKNPKNRKKKKPPLLWFQVNYSENAELYFEFREEIIEMHKARKDYEPGTCCTATEKYEYRYPGKIEQLKVDFPVTWKEHYDHEYIRQQQQQQARARYKGSGYSKEKIDALVEDEVP